MLVIRKKADCLKRFYLLIIVIIAFQANAQERQFWNEIRDFKKQDSLRFPPKKAILFVGSSTFRIWNDLQNDFPNHQVINRGFGGSGLLNVVEYANEIVFPYQPKQIIIYCGENDFYLPEGATPQIVMSRFQTLFEMIRKKLPKAHITFVSLKPSPRRQALIPQMEQANTLIKNFLTKHSRTSFVNIWEDMLDAQGNPRKELFREDSLHMNRDGYLIWIKEIRPYLKRTRKPGL